MNTAGSALDRLLRPFADVRTGEGRTALLLALNVFLILTAYYVLKPVREALMLGEYSAELKSYLSAAQVVLLAFVVPYYGRLVKRLPRRPLLNAVTGFFVVCLLAFFVLGRTGVNLGIPFFLWIGIFNLMIVAQFWSFANDIYSKDEGERLFPVVGFGASLGAVFGARVAARLIDKVGVYELMLVGAGLLVAQALVTNYVDAHWGKAPVAAAPEAATPSVSRAGAFGMVFRTRYLLLMAIMLMLLNWVNTTGEYILGSIVSERAHAEAGGDPQAVEAAIGSFYSYYYTLVNVLGLLLQMFVVSRLVKRWGVPAAVLVLPVISLLSYGIIMIYPVLRAVLAGKVAENSADYSINNTVRNMLFLPCTKEQKYTAKQVIDSFFVRTGDVLSAALIFAGTAWLGLHPRGFALVNAALVAAWLFLAWRVGREYKTLSASGLAPAASR